jgi:hypothetical protein
MCLASDGQRNGDGDPSRAVQNGSHCTGRRERRGGGKRPMKSYEGPRRLPAVGLWDWVVKRGLSGSRILFASGQGRVAYDTVSL